MKGMNYASRYLMWRDLGSHIVKVVADIYSDFRRQIFVVVPLPSHV